MQVLGVGDIPANVAGMNGMEYMPAAGAQRHQGEQQTPKAGLHARAFYVHQSLYLFRLSSGSIRRGIKDTLLFFLPCRPDVIPLAF